MSIYKKESKAALGAAVRTHGPSITAKSTTRAAKNRIEDALSTADITAFCEGPQATLTWEKLKGNLAFFLTGDEGRDCLKRCIERDAGITRDALTQLFDNVTQSQSTPEEKKDQFKQFLGKLGIESTTTLPVPTVTDASVSGQNNADFNLNSETKYVAVDAYIKAITGEQTQGKSVNVGGNPEMMREALKKSLAKMVEETGPIKREFIDTPHSKRIFIHGEHRDLLATYVVNGQITREALQVLYNAVTSPLPSGKQRTLEEKKKAFETFLTSKSIGIGIDSSAKLSFPSSEIWNSGAVLQEYLSPPEIKHSVDSYSKILAEIFEILEIEKKVRKKQQLTDDNLVIIFRAILTATQPNMIEYEVMNALETFPQQPLLVPLSLVKEVTSKVSQSEGVIDLPDFVEEKFKKANSNYSKSKKREVTDDFKFIEVDVQEYDGFNSVNDNHPGARRGSTSSVNSFNAVPPPRNSLLARNEQLYMSMAWFLFDGDFRKALSDDTSKKTPDYFAAEYPTLEYKTDLTPEGLKGLPNFNTVTVQNFIQKKLNGGENPTLPYPFVVTVETKGKNMHVEIIREDVAETKLSGGGGRLSRSQRRKRRRATKAKRGGSRKKYRPRSTRKNNKKSRSRSRSKSSKKRRVNARK